MASYPHNSTSNKSKPWPAYFIVRATGEVVPLIGVDELPRAFEAQQPASTQSSTRPTTPSSTLPETKICRHWCTHGICKLGQRCRYQHIMPMTHSGLQETGLSDWPAWYRASNPDYFTSECTHLNLNLVGEEERRVRDVAAVDVIGA